MIRAVLRHFAECLIHDDDPPENKYIKRSFTPVVVFFIAVSLFVLVQFWLRGLYGLVISIGFPIVGFVWYLVGSGTRRVSFGRVLDVMLFFVFAGILLGDFASAALGGQRLITVVIITLDAALLFERDHILPIMVCSTLLYLLVERCEASLHLGLYEIIRIGSAPSIAICDCDSPPCSVPAIEAINGFVFFVCVLIVDFHLTRGFASGLRHQLRQMQTMISMTQEVTSALARYDVDCAEKELQEAKLPLALHSAYSVLFVNLRSYRAYLPQSCLVHDDFPHREDLVVEESFHNRATSHLSRCQPPPSQTCEVLPVLGGLSSASGSGMGAASGAPSLPSAPGSLPSLRVISPATSSLPRAGGAVRRLSSTSPGATPGPGHTPVQPATPASPLARGTMSYRRGSSSADQPSVYFASVQRFTSFLSDKADDSFPWTVSQTTESGPSREKTDPRSSEEASGVVSPRDQRSPVLSLRRSSPTKARMASRRRVSLLSANRLGTMRLEEGFTEAEHAEWLADDVQEWVQIVSRVKGIVDYVGGDRRSASFNARQACESHSTAAVMALSAYSDAAAHSGEQSYSGLRVTGCVVSGDAVCGDFGSIFMMRFMVLGPLTSSLAPFERAAAAWCVPVLADADAHERAQYHWEGLLLGAVVYQKRGPRPKNMFSMKGRRPKVEAAEWMYEMANLQEGPIHQENERREAVLKEKVQCFESRPFSLSGRLRDVDFDSVRHECGVWTLSDVGLTPTVI
eukprot:Hpha_TRINITY_DN22579_c0_g1::TRINITY_DN22579_c0_g1_i1::g.185091::m.185091